MPKGVVPPRITTKDRIILDFLNTGADRGEVPCEDPIAMSKALHRRIKAHDLSGLKSHLVGGKCSLEIVNGSRQSLISQFEGFKSTRERMLRETKDRQKLLLKSKDYGKIRRDTNRLTRIRECASQVVDTICYDFAEPDREFLKEEVTKKFQEVNTRGRAYDVQMAAILYLLSKCPSSAEKPLQFKEVYERYCKLPDHSQISTFYNAIKDAKKAGMQTCRITPEIVLNSKKAVLLKFAQEHGISQEEMLGVISNSIDYTKLGKIKIELQGKNPFVVASASLYKHRGQNGALTQEEIRGVFNVTTVSIRNTIRRFEEIDGSGEQ